MDDRKFFFSYARKDGDFVLRLARELRASGVDLWVDQLDIRGGQRWDRTVEEALRACPGMIVVLSPESLASDNVMDEVSYALEERKLLIPILFRPCEVPFRLRRVHYVDFTNGYEAGLEQLLRALQIERRPEPLLTLQSSEATPTVAQATSPLTVVAPGPRPSTSAGRKAGLGALIENGTGLLGAGFGCLAGVVYGALFGGNLGVRFAFIPGLEMTAVFGAAAGALAWKNRTASAAAVGGLAIGLAGFAMWAIFYPYLDQIGYVAFFGGPGGAAVGAATGRIVGQRRTRLRKVPYQPHENLSGE